MTDNSSFKVLFVFPHIWLDEIVEVNIAGFNLKLIEAEDPNIDKHRHDTFLIGGINNAPQ